MSSGHKSGLQNASDFARAETKLKKRQKKELARYNAANEEGETIRRDASGKRRTASSAAPDEAQLLREEEEKELQQQQRQANKGTYQKRQDEARVREMEEAATMTLARTVDDVRMEERKKAVIRSGDPMAQHAWQKQREESAKRPSGGKGSAAALVPTRPMYKGPQPKPNRHGLRPGYRWDGIDRGNGFEDKVLEMLHSKGRKKEEAYKWSSADM